MERFDVFVIGGGGTGSEVAFTLARSSDLSVAIAERHRLGGECNLYGCVPTKVMLRSTRLFALARDGARFGLRIPEVGIDFGAVQRRASDVVEQQSGAGPKPFEEEGIRVLLDEARIVGEHRVELADGTQVEADRVVLATGSEPSIPPIPGLADGPFWTNREAIWDPKEPPRRLAVIGTGAIGVEFAQLYRRFGSEVTAIEMVPRILPHEDEDAAASLASVFEAEGIRVVAGATIRSARYDADGWTLAIEGGPPVSVDEVLVAAGRRPVLDGHDLDAVGLEVDDRGRPVLDDTLRTTAPDVWAAGDVTGDLLFTHVGNYEAEIVANDILGRPEPRDYRVVPRVTFTDPEVGSVGLTEEQARSEGHDVLTAVVHIADNERSLIDGRPAGIVKLVADRGEGTVLGGHIVADEAGTMIHEVVAIMAARATATAVARAIHAYPTLSESVKAALLGIEARLG
ncbi:MAG TPA: NAD(P)/FAD-dependent oxidoreductase [Actinomycetota bacterium]|nr:NAD(P)/FAD-dependent oxidoreductase [Actinomycetota bacterium]